MIGTPSSAPSSVSTRMRQRTQTLPASFTRYLSLMSQILLQTQSCQINYAMKHDHRQKNISSKILIELFESETRPFIASACGCCGCRTARVLMSWARRSGSWFSASPRSTASSTSPSSRGSSPAARWSGSPPPCPTWC